MALATRGKRLLIALGVVTALLLGTAVSGSARSQHIRGGLAASAGTNKPATVTTGSCPTPGTHFVAADNTGVSTTSTTYVDVPDMSVSFTTTGTRAWCAVATFSAWSFASGDALLYVQAVMDGTVIGAPGEQQFDGDSDEDADGKWAASHAFTFVFPSVSVGAHTIKIQYRSYDGKTVFLHRRSLTVFHH
jgi:hypothetical protein